MDIQNIVETAQTVATQSEDLRSAIDIERTAEAEVLTAAIEAARPALRAICSKLVARDLTTGNGDVNRHREQVEYHQERGVHLAGDSKAEEDQPRDNSGAYEGYGLYLLVDGRLANRTWSGSWSRWQGSTTECVSVLEPVTAREAMDEWELSECLENLGKALQKQADGNASERAQAARERAEKLRAMLTLARK
jgi:hypothetical protein